MFRLIGPCLAAVVILPVPAPAQTTLPLVEGADWRQVRDHCQKLIRGLEALKAPLPSDTVAALNRLLEKEPADSDAALAEVQKLLDAQCLVGVNINPESRVKAARGPAAAELVRDREKVVLVKIHNDGGVTHALAVTGPQVRNETDEKGKWLEAVIASEAPFAKKLTGQRLEYVVLRLTAREAGKREATLKFDVGQGTQDLGFRAEVPVLFTVRAP
jgi:hypothetical protein